MKCKNCQYVECPECKCELETRCPKCQPNIAMADTFFGIFDYQLESQRVDGDALILTYVKHEPAKMERIEMAVDVPGLTEAKKAMRGEPSSFATPQKVEVK